MSAQPIEPPAPGPQPVSPQQRLNAVEATVAYLNLPTARPLIVRDDAVHVVVVDSEQLAHWLYKLGGDINRAPALDGASLWTLRTETPRRADGSTVAIRVHAALVHDEDVPTGFVTREAVNA